MDRLKVLIQGEFNRLNKYNMLTANIVVLLFYIGVSYFIEGEELKQFIPMIILLDAGMMTTLMVGATLFYEKKEHTMSTMMISPVNENELMLSKVITSVLNSYISFIVIALGMYFLKDITFEYGHYIIAIPLVATFHALIGFVLSYVSRDFSGLLMAYMFYVLVFMLPSFLILAGVITNETVIDLLVLLPPEASSVLFMSAGNIGDGATMYPLIKVLGSGIYLAVISFGLFKFYIKPKFHDYAIKEAGV